MVPICRLGCTGHLQQCWQQLQRLKMVNDVADSCKSAVGPEGDIANKLAAVMAILPTAENKVAATGLDTFVYVAVGRTVNNKLCTSFTSAANETPSFNTKYAATAFVSCSEVHFQSHPGCIPACTGTHASVSTETPVCNETAYAAQCLCGAVGRIAVSCSADKLMVGHVLERLSGTSVQVTHM